MNRFRPSSLGWIFLLFLIQNSLNYVFPGKAPNCVLIGVLFFSLRDGSYSGMTAGAFGGFFLDLLGIGALGFSMITYATFGALAGFVSTRIFRESLMTEIFLPILCFYGITIAEVIFVKSQLGEPLGAGVLIEGFLIWPFLATMAASPIIFSFLGKGAARSRRNSSYTFR